MSTKSDEQERLEKIVHDSNAVETARLVEEVNHSTERRAKERKEFDERQAKEKTEFENKLKVPAECNQKLIALELQELNKLMLAFLGVPGFTLSLHSKCANLLIVKGLAAFVVYSIRGKWFVRVRKASDNNNYDYINWKNGNCPWFTSAWEIFEYISQLSDPDSISELERFIDKNRYTSVPLPPEPVLAACRGNAIDLEKVDKCQPNKTTRKRKREKSKLKLVSK